MEPAVLLLDEPLSALDLKLRQHMRAELKTIQRKTGVTFIYITHDQGEALTMSDRIAVMNQGRVEQVATTDDIYDEPDDAVRGDLRRRAERVPRSQSPMSPTALPRIETSPGRLTGRNRHGWPEATTRMVFVRPERMHSLTARVPSNRLSAMSTGAIWKVPSSTSSWRPTATRSWSTSPTRAQPGAT